MAKFSRKWSIPAEVEEIRISRAAPPVKSGTHRRGSQPGRESAKIPLRTNVRTRAQDDEETQLVCNAYEPLNVLRSVPFKLARIQLMMVPGNVHLSRMSQRSIESKHDGLQVLGSAVDEVEDPAQNPASDVDVARAASI